MTTDSQIVQQFEEFLAVRKNQRIEAQIIEAVKIIYTIAKVDSKMIFSKVQKRIIL